MTITQSSKIQETPMAESTRVPLKTSTDRREIKEKKEPLTPDRLLEMEQTKLYKRELEEAEEDMVRAYLEKSKLEKEEAEIIRQGALKAQGEFETLEQKQDENRGNPLIITQNSKIQETPMAESTRVPLKTSTDRREIKEKKEPLTPDQLLEMEQTKLYKRELEEAEEDMV